MSNTPEPVSESTARDNFVRQVAEKQATSDTPDQEQSLWSGGYSAKAMLGTWMIVLLLTVGVVVAPFFTTLPWTIAAPVAIGLWVIVGCIFSYRRLGYHYELTSQRFIHQVGVLSRRTDRIEVIDIDDVSFFQGPVQRMLGIGTIEITGSDRTHPRLMMHGIANVKHVAGMIDDIRRKERKRRSLHIQSV